MFLDQWCLIVRNLSSLHDQNSQLVEFGTNFLSSVFKILLNDDFNDSIKEKILSHKRKSLKSQTTEVSKWLREKLIKTWRNLSKKDAGSIATVWKQEKKKKFSIDYRHILMYFSDSMYLTTCYVSVNFHCPGEYS